MKILWEYYTNRIITQKLFSKRSNGRIELKVLSGKIWPN
jgi:hypothetical protein